MKITVLCGVAFALMVGTVRAVEKKAPAKSEPTTLENLQAAYNGEWNAKIKYEMFAARAEMEGYLGVSGLFRAVAVSEGIHAAKHSKAIEALGAVAKVDLETPVVGSTKENLKEAINGENHESKKMYPAFLKKAKADKNRQAMYGFKGAMAAEKEHSRLYSQALSNLEAWKANRKFLVCQTCGYTTADLKLKLCPVCSQPRSQFTEIE